MTDYDAADHIITILNALTWGAIPEPAYQEGTTYKNSEIPAVLLISLRGIRPLRESDSTIRWQQQVEVQFHYATKATAWAALEFVVQSLMKYTNGTKYVEPDSFDVDVRYTESRKIYALNFIFNEVKTE